MEMPDYADYDGLGLAELVAKKAVTPLELVEAAIERIEKHNPTLNAVVYKGYDDARRWATGDLPDGPFKGVPFLIKDLHMPVAGWPRTSGSRFCRHVVDAEDGGLTRRYRQAGVVPVGKSNLPEFGITGTTESAFLGACRNPWSPGHSTGGSSGGSAAAVAAGIVPLAHGGDGLGSIRIPAACCGVVGLKVTRDRNPNRPDGYDYAYGLVVDNVMTRTVRDSAAMLDATGYPDPASPYAPPPKARPYMEEIQASPGRLRIGWRAGRELHPDVEATLLATVALLSQLGHDVFERRLDVDFRALNLARGPAGGANFAGGMSRIIDEIGREPEPDELEPLTWASLKAGRRVTGAEAMRSLQAMRAMNYRTLAAFENLDAYLTPVMTAPAPEIGWLDPVAVPPREVNERQAQLYPYCAPFNFSGQPSISLPLGMSQDGLPIGMMFTAKYADEATLFRLAAQLENEAPWKDRRPQVWG
ncbi:amidase [Phenylobacterium sp.]|jgi:amidase|uniref:amidase n=1 Tax=Phenylobacterium sp. TaxID=1871053 RepID=UPI002E33A8BA|nr:amidase family protein [Phenylobacterium sp.]HEX3367102.1 amidase family protein [Phenylobacterium sp.]